MKVSGSAKGAVGVGSQAALLLERIQDVERRENHQQVQVAALPPGSNRRDKGLAVAVDVLAGGLPGQIQAAAGRQQAGERANRQHRRREDNALHRTAPAELQERDRLADQPHHGRD